MLGKKEFILEAYFNQASRMPINFSTLSFVEHIIPCFHSKSCLKKPPQKRSLSWCPLKFIHLIQTEFNSALMCRRGKLGHEAKRWLNWGWVWRSNQVTNPITCRHTRGYTHAHILSGWRGWTGSKESCDSKNIEYRCPGHGCVLFLKVMISIMVELCASYVMNLIQSYCKDL